MWLKRSYHHRDSFTVADEVHIRFPAISLHDLSGGPGVVHGVSRHQILTVWRPGQTQDVGRPTTLTHRERPENIIQTLIGELWVCMNAQTRHIG